LASGYGAPVDRVDAVCKEFALCYKCIDIDFGGACNPEKRGYKWGKVRDANNTAIDVMCKNNHNEGPAHRCARFTCECDRVLAIGLATVYADWNITFHARWTPLAPSDPGYFSKETDCITIAGQYTQDQCCGAYGAATHDVHQMSNAHTGQYPLKPYPRRPYSTQNPSNGCCQDAAIYDINNQECCVLPDNFHAEHPDKHFPDGSLIPGIDRSPDSSSDGDLDLSSDVEVVPVGSCAGLGGTVVAEDDLGDWGPGTYAKK